MRRLALTLALGVTLALAAAAPAMADLGFREVGLQVSGIQAGIHPEDVVTTLDMQTILDEGENLEYPDEQLQNLTVDLPEGFAGNPTATERCTSAQFAVLLGTGIPSCPNSAAVGYVAVKAEFDPIEPGAPAYFHLPVFNMVPPPGKAAKLGFYFLAVPVTLDVGLRESPPYNVYASLTNISQAALFYGSRFTLWGNPASPEHDTLRGSCLNALDPTAVDVVLSNGSCKANTAEKPFITATRSCEGPLPAAFNGLAWNTHNTAAATAIVAGRSGCAKLGFAAEASVQPTTTAAESASGLSFELEIEDEGLSSPKEGATAFSDIKRVRVAFPKGVTFNPSQADGLGVCSEADLARETASSPFGAGCPASSRIGSVEVETPLLEGKVLHGSMFVAQPHQNPYDTLIALYMVVKSPELGIAVKLPGRVDSDLLDGQITATFGDPSAKDPALRALPQVPLGSVRVNLRAGARSPLVTPPTCGTYAIESTLTPWANPANPYPISSSFQITSGPGGAPCPPAGVPPFAPGFEAGSANNNAGSPSPFLMRLTRSDGDQNMTRFDAVLPEGVVPKLAGVPQCPDAAIAAAKAKSGTEEILAPSCPAASQIGRVAAGAGVGGELTWVAGKIYLAGPHGGAPMSAVVITPAVAGPFDVGTVVVREAIDINPVTYRGEIDGAASDPIPHILAGIPLKLKDLRVFVDRPDFMRNPTSCAEQQTLAQVFGSFADPFAPADDLAVSREARYQAASCQSLDFGPRLRMALSGQMKRGGNPALRAVLTPRPGDANIGRATILLPPSELIDNAHVNNPCTRDQFAAEACPKSSILGRARAFTPLLDEPLEGPVYFRSNGGVRNLPDIVLDLRGQFGVTVVGFIDSRNARVRTRFQSAPDAPVSKLVVRLYGGKRGLLENNRHLCKAKLRPRFTLVGQNGKRSVTRPLLGTSCKRKSAANRHSRSR